MPVWLVRVTLFQNEPTPPGSTTSNRTQTAVHRKLVALPPGLPVIRSLVESSLPHLFSGEQTQAIEPPTTVQSRDTRLQINADAMHCHIPVGTNFS
jgi:hypothetical protein